MTREQMMQLRLRQAQAQSQPNVIPTLGNSAQISNLSNATQNPTPQPIAPQNQPISDYKSYIEDAQRQLNEQGKTEGEIKALNDYLSNLNAMQQYVDNQRAEEQRKAQEKQRIATQKAQKQATQNQNVPQKTKREQMIEEAKAFGRQSLENAKKNDTLASHGYSLSPNEQRDYERAMSAQANALKKQSDKALEEAKKQVVQDKSKSVSQTNFANGQNTLKTGVLEKTNLTQTEKWLDPTYKLSKAEKKEAKQIIKDFDTKEFERNKAINEMPTNLSANEQRDYLRGHNAYEPIDEREKAEIDQLRNKVNSVNALANGLMSVTPGVGIVPAIQTLLNPNNAKEFEKAEEERNQANTQNPLAYYGGLIGGGLAYSLGGQGMLKGTKYGETIGKLTGANGVNTSLGKQILGDALLDAPVDLLTDTIPELLQNVATGSKDTGKDLITNLALNGAFNLGASALGNVDEIKNVIKKTNNNASTVDNLNPLAEKINSGNPEIDIKNRVTAAPNSDITIDKGTTSETGLHSPLGSDIPKATENVNPIEETLAKEFPREQTPEMRINQNAQNVSQVVQPKELTGINSDEYKSTIRDMFDNLDMDENVRANATTEIANIENILDDFNKAQTQDEIMSVMDRFEQSYRNLENQLKGNASYSQTIDTGLKEQRTALNNAMKGMRINVSDIAKGELTDQTMRDLNNAIFGGVNSGRFVRNGGTSVDTVFSEIDQATGNALSRYMVENGLDPSVTENQIKGITDYARSLKGSGSQVQTQTYKGGELLDDVFKDMIDNAGTRGLDIDENTLREKMKVSAFRTHNQGQFGLTDEELNNEYFNSQNEHFRFLKGNNEESVNQATKNLDTDYEGTVNRLLNKPTTEQFTPTEVDEGFMSYFRELDNARETGDYSKSAEMMYRMTQDAHDKGAGLQAYGKWKKNSPAGVVLEANSVARDLAQSSKGKDFVNDVDDIVSKTKNILDSGKTYDEMYNELKSLFDEKSAKGYKGGLNGFEQMDELLRSGQNVDTVGIKDILYAANKIPNLDVSAQKEIADIAQDMFGKELSLSEKQQYLNRINEILSRQNNWSLKDKLIEMQHILMLSGLRTHEKNALANVGMLPTSALARKVSALGQSGYALLNPNFKPTQAFKVSKGSRELAERVLADKGGVNAIAEGVTDKYSGQLAQNIGATYMFPGSGKKNVVAKANDFLTDKIPFLKKAETGISNTANKMFNKIGADGAYSTMNPNVSTFENYRQFIYGSMGALEDNPFVKKNFVDRLASFIEARGITNLSDVPQEAIDIARNEALKATFKDDNSITKLFQSIKGIPAIGETLLPYVKTPANLLARSIDYSPIGIARELYGLFGNNKFSRETIGEAFDELAKGVSGTLIGGLATYLYANDVFSGAEPEDKEVADYIKSKGWQPWSISTKGIADFINSKLGTNLDLGDSYVDWSWLQPSTTNWIAGIAFYDELNDGKAISEKTPDEIWQKARGLVGSYVDTLLSQSTLQDVGQLFDTQYGNNVGENLFDNFMEIPTRFFSGAVYDATKLADNTKREYYSKGQPLKTTVDMAKSKIPFLSKTLPAKYDAFGEEISRNPSEKSNVINTLFNPANTTSIDGNELYSFIDNNNANASKEKYTPDVKPDRYFNAVGDDGEFKRNLNNEEYSRMTDVIGDTRKELVGKISSIENLDDFEPDNINKMLKAVEKVAKAVGKLEVEPNAKISDEDMKYLNIYNESGADGLIDSLKDKYNSDAMAIKNAINGKQRGQTEADASLSYLDSTDMSKAEKGKLLWDNLTPNKETTALQENGDYEGIYDHYKNKSKNDTTQSANTTTTESAKTTNSIPTLNDKDYYSEWVAKEGVKDSDKTKEIYDAKGSNVAKAYAELNNNSKEYGSVSSKTTIPYLENNKTLSDDQKGYVLSQVNQIAKGAERAKQDVGSDAGIYYYYNYKYNADQKGDKNGSLKKAELINYLTSVEGMSNTEAENIYAKWYKR